MKHIALTGGIAAGKTTVAEHFRHLGYPVIDYDVLAREVIEKGSPALEEIYQEFGKDAVDEQGELNRKWMAANVFVDKAYLHRLNAIMHPAIYQRAVDQDNKLRQAGEKLVVHDIPLLAETWETAQQAGLEFDMIMDVEAPENVRIERMMTSRSMTYEAAQARINSQSRRMDREKIADVIIDSTQSIPHMYAQVDAAVKKLVAQN